MSLNITFDKDFLDAANYVLQEHLSKTYQDGTGDGGRERGIKRSYIDRPLHGLVHAMRKVAYAPVYYQLLKQKGVIGIDKINETELKKIMIALLFQISGRQSEYNDGGKRQQYREASAQNFENFASKHMSHLFTAQDIKKFRTIIAEPHHNSYERSLEMRIMRQLHALELIRLQDKAAEMFYISPEYIGIAGGIQKQFNEEDAVAFMNYITALFEATGDSLHAFDIAPGKKFLLMHTYQETTYPEGTPVFKKAAILPNLALFEECQYSAAKCLTQILAVKPPFGITYQASNIEHAQIMHVPEQDNELEKQMQQKLTVLRDQELKLREELAEKNEFLQLPDLGPQEADLKIQVQHIQAELMEIEKKKKALGALPEYNWRSGNYEVKAINVMCKDGLVRDEVRIPGDNNCCYNAALVAAKHAGVQLPPHIQNHYQLRMAVAKKMREDFRLNPHDDSFAAAIEGYNREFRTNIRTFDEYIKEVEKLETWGGEYELSIMAQILNVNIVDHTDRQPRPFVMGTNPHLPTLHLHHTGAHYNFYVAPGSWQGLSHDDPVLLFDQNYVQFKQKIYQARLASLEKDKIIKLPIKVKDTRQGIAITYENYFKLSTMQKAVEGNIQQLTSELKKEDLPEDKALRLKKELARDVSQYEQQKADLEEMRQVFWSPHGGGELFQHYKILLEEYNAHVQLLSSILQELQDLHHQKIKMTLNKDTDSIEYKGILSKIEEKYSSFTKDKTQLDTRLGELESELEFIIREIPNMEEKALEMANMNAMKAQVKRLNAEIQAKPQVKMESVIYTHLKSFLGQAQAEGLSLAEQVELFFNDVNVRAMLFVSYKTALLLGHGSEPIFLESPGDDAVVHAIGTGADVNHAILKNNGAQYNPKYLEHFKRQLVKMVETEVQQGENYALYNAMSSALCCGNDVIQELNAMLFAQDQSLFRLFSDNFQFEDAQAFRKHVFEDKKVDDTNPEFHLRGIACGISPFQITQNECPFDFWVRGVNLNQFDRWKYEILPKITQMTDNHLLINELTDEYNQLVALSAKLGSRMTQFLLNAEDIDTYAWLSGGFGYQIPSADEKGQPTYHLSEALDYYQKSPDAFIKENKMQREQFFATGALAKNQQEQAYDKTYDNFAAERRNLAQLQGRLYLHPALFAQGRCQVNTYYSLDADQKLIDEYNSRVRQFSQKVGGLIIRAKLEGKFLASTKAKPSEDLLKSIVALRPYNYADAGKLETAFNLIRQQAMAGMLALPPLPNIPFYEIIRQMDNVALSQELDKLHDPLFIRDALSKCFYCAIAHGDLKTLDALFEYYQKYSLKKNPAVDFDKLSDAKHEESALIIAAKFNQPAILNRLVALRDSYYIRRTVQEPGTLNSPLHYLAEYGNVEAFKALARSLTEKRSWTSYYAFVGNSSNKENNTPLHVLAINEPHLSADRLAILNFLLAKENESLFDKLMGKESITQSNSNGLSPIMIAALTQNLQAVSLLAQKAGLSQNQTGLYLWVAQDPINRLGDIQDNLHSYGDIPGFVSARWAIPLSFRENVVSDAHVIEAKKPHTIQELKDQFEGTLALQDPKIFLHAYNELSSAIGPKVSDYLSELVAALTLKGAAQELQNLSQVVEKNGIKITLAKLDENPLISAAKKGDVKTVLQLLEAKQELNVQRTKADANNMGALHYLVQIPGTEEAVIALLKNRTWSQTLGGLAWGSYDPTTMQNNEGNTAAHLIAQVGNDALLARIEHEFSSKATFVWGATNGLKAQLNAASKMHNNEGKTPIMVAVFENPHNLELIKFFAKAMDLSSLDTSQYLALANAISSGNKQHIQFALTNMEKVYGWNAKFNKYEDVENALAQARAHQRLRG